MDIEKHTKPNQSLRLTGDGRLDDRRRPLERRQLSRGRLFVPRGGATGVAAVAALVAASDAEHGAGGVAPGALADGLEVAVGGGVVELGALVHVGLGILGARLVGKMDSYSQYGKNNGKHVNVKFSSTILPD